MQRAIHDKTLAFFERDVVDQVRAALNMPLAPRIKWFAQVAQQMAATARQLGYEPTVRMVRREAGR